MFITDIIYVPACKIPSPSYFADCNGPWTQLGAWAGPNPVVYRNFEVLTAMTLVNEAQLVPGKVTVL